MEFGLVACCACLPFLPDKSAIAQSSVETVELSEITVEGAGRTGAEASNPESPLKAQGYVATSSEAATKTQTPLVEVPQSISTITRQQLDDRNVQTLTSAVTYTPGVRANAAGFEPRFDLLSIRGFNAIDQGVFRDGLREVNGPFFTFKTEPYGLDGVSVIKGPASSLYGGSTPGGLIELTTKRPTFAPFGEVEAQIGNNDRRQGQFDVGGPIGDGETFAYRVTGVLRDSDTDVPGAPDDKVYIAPAFTWKPNEDTKFTVLSEYSRIRTGANLAYYNDYSSGRPVVTNIYSGDSAYNAFRQEQARIGYELEHKLSQAVTLRQKLRFAHVEGDAEYVDIDNIKPGKTFSHRTAGAITGRLDTLNVDNQLEAKGDTGPVSHTLLMGFDAQYADVVDKWGSANSRKNPEWVSPILLDPLTYGGHIWSPNDNDTNTRQKQLNVGLYVQDQLKAGRFVATLGLRKDWVGTDTDNRLAKGNGLTEQDDSKLTGRAGLTFLGPYGLNPYVSYGTSFAPTLGTDRAGKKGAPFVPTTGEQYEAGVKFAPPDQNLVLTAAVFDITQQNVVRTDPSGLHPSVQTGEVRSKGFEFEATGTLANGLSFTAGYAYLEPTFVKGEPGNDGNQVSAIPKHAASLWASYDFQPGTALAGLNIAGGARYVGPTFGDDENTFKNKDYLLFDAALRFEFEHVAPRLKGVALQLNARNLADTEITTCEQGYCYRDEGRQVIASLRYRW
jgi:iron complex outermembrane receptor protein